MKLKNIEITGLHNWRTIFDEEMSKVKTLEDKMRQKL
jgi:hypothetical protein